MKKSPLNEACSNGFDELFAINKETGMPTDCLYAHVKNQIANTAGPYFLHENPEVVKAFGEFWERLTGEKK